MRLFEVILSVTITVVIISNLHSKITKRNKALILFTIFVISIFHLILEGSRWQMVGIYISIILLLISSHRNYHFKVLYKVFYLFMITVSVILSILLPIFKTPNPTGEYFVGSMELDLEDTERLEWFTKDTSDIRRIKIKSWYPVENYKGETDKFWANRSVGEAYASALGLPGFIYNHIDLIKTHTYSDTTILDREQKFPVIIFSHGLTGNVSQNRVLMEELASQGYVSFSIGHTYDAAAVVFSNGETVNYSQIRMKEMQELSEKTRDIFNKAHETVNMKEKQESLLLYYQNETWEKKNIETRVSDVLYLLDRLTDLNREQFSNRLDLNRIGLIGHSFGGTTTAEVCIKDNRIRAGVNLDGYHIYREEKITQPFMIINAEDSRDENEHIYDKFSHDRYVFTLLNSGHLNFSDDALLSPIMKVLGLTGRINPYLALEITNEYVTDFFNKYLMGEYSPILDANSNSKNNLMEQNL